MQIQIRLSDSRMFVFCLFVYLFVFVLVPVYSMISTFSVGRILSIYTNLAKTYSTHKPTCFSFSFE